MKKRVLIALAVLVVMAVGVTIWVGLREQEPVYRGKRLNVWLEQCSSDQPDVRQSAITAIRSIGADGIPIYLKMMATPDSSLKSWVRNRLPASWAARLGLKREQDQRQVAASALIALGADAKGAVPGLIGLLGQTNHTAVRLYAVLTLKMLGPVASDALPSLVNCLKDPDIRVRSGALGGLRQQPQLAVPLLVPLLDRTNNILVRANTIWTLREMRAKPAVPSLFKLLNDADVNIRMEATNALKAIDPEQAAKAGLN